jgi:hypothetical protein
MRHSNPDRRTIPQTMTSLAAASSMAKISAAHAEGATASDPALSPALADVDQALRQAVNARTVPGAALHRPTGESRKSRAAGTNVEGLSIAPVREPEVTNRPIRFDFMRSICRDFMRSIWSGAIVGCISAAVIPPFPEADHEGS